MCNRAFSTRLFTPLFAIMALAMAPSRLSASGGATAIRVVPENIFAPPGFDDNDNAQITVQGHFPSTCYRMGPALAKVDPYSGRILVRNIAYFYSGQMCGDVMIPYSQTINLGVLRHGNYKIYAEGPNGAVIPKSLLPVAVARTAAADDFLYPVIKDATVEFETQDLIIQGELVNTCMTLKTIQVLFRSPQIVEVLPIAEMVGSGPSCRPAHIPFTRRIPLRNSPWHGDVLIHVRSLNGQAINETSVL